MKFAFKLLVALGCFAVTPMPTRADSLPCRPCAGIRVDNPLQIAAELERQPRLSDDSRFYLAWRVELDGSGLASTVESVRSSGAVPWLDFRFTTPAPLIENINLLEQELAAASTLARAAGPRGHFQISWQPPQATDPQSWAKDYSFLLKRAAVAVSGAQPTGRVITQALSADPEVLRALFDNEIAAYVDGLALELRDTETLQVALHLLSDLDPGKPVVLDSIPFPSQPEETLAIAAAESVAGFALTLFETQHGDPPSLDAIKILAEEFKGDLSYDPYSSPTGNPSTKAWSFVRGEDLSLRVVVFHGTQVDPVEITFSDAQLRGPARIDFSSGEARDMYSGFRSEQGFNLQWQTDSTVTLLRLNRLTASEIEGIEGLDERIAVTSERQLPVEEILRRLQSVEDAQNRRLSTYRAVNTTHLRFQIGTQGIDVTFEGEIFFRRGQPFDWAWQDLYLNGLRWRGKKLPEIPLIEPKRAANLPLEILFTKEYRYRLRGTAMIDGRDTWVIDFQPQVSESEESLFRGTVWIDRQLFTRVRSKAVQLGLAGEVISNEETIFYAPFDESGQLVEAQPEQIWLPNRVVSQQIWSLFNTATVVEKEMTLTSVEINDERFEERREELLASESTMVRDTEEGLRYLVPDKETGKRVVKTKTNPNRLFFAGGVFHDDSFDYPLPLLGVDFFSLDFMGTGAQVNALFAGVILIGNIADPSFLGSKFDAGADLFLVGPAFTNTVFKDDREVFSEEIKQRPASVDFSIGHKVGNFFKLNATYSLDYLDFGRTDNTADEFVLPVDHFTNSLGLQASYNRSGYRLRLSGQASSRSNWEPWGFADSGDFDPDDKDFFRWEASVAKTFHLSGFKKAGFELRYVDGENLDRFSKYEFGFFGDVFIRGYQMERVRADSAVLVNTSYGFEMGELFRLQFLGDGAWATDEDTGLDNEFLAGVGVAGTVIGPWQTVVRLDLGVAVAGPDEGITVFLTLLKLYK